MGKEIFSDMVCALEQVGKDFLALKGLTEKERQHYREVIDETYSVLDSAVTLVLCRLGNLLQIEEQDVFIKELRTLDNFEEWVRLEREVRLCGNLRAAGSEMSRLWNRFMGHISLKDSNAFGQLLYQCLEQGEGKLANFISSSLSKLADMAEDAAHSSSGYEEAKKEVRKTKDILRRERVNLISSEIEFLKKI